MILANIEGICWSSYYIPLILVNIEIPQIVSFLLEFVTTITRPTILGLLIRFQRVQVQLRAQDENTIKIL